MIIRKPSLSRGLVFGLAISAILWTAALGIARTLI